MLFDDTSHWLFKISKYIWTCSYMYALFILKLNINRTIFFQFYTGIFSVNLPCWPQAQWHPLQSSSPLPLVRRDVSHRTINFVRSDGRSEEEIFSHTILERLCSIQCHGAVHIHLFGEGILTNIITRERSWVVICHLSYSGVNNNFMSPPTNLCPVTCFFVFCMTLYFDWVCHSFLQVHLGRGRLPHGDWMPSHRRHLLAVATVPFCGRHDCTGRHDASRYLDRDDAKVFGFKVLGRLC